MKGDGEVVAGQTPVSLLELQRTSRARPEGDPLEEPSSSDEPPAKRPARQHEDAPAPAQAREPGGQSPVARVGPLEALDYAGDAFLELPTGAVSDAFPLAATMPSLESVFARVPAKPAAAQPSAAQDAFITRAVAAVATRHPDLGLLTRDGSTYPPASALRASPPMPLSARAWLAVLGMPCPLVQQRGTQAAAAPAPVPAVYRGARAQAPPKPRAGRHGDLFEESDSDGETQLPSTTVLNIPATVPTPATLPWCPRALALQAGQFTAIGADVELQREEVAKGDPFLAFLCAQLGSRTAAAGA